MAGALEDLLDELLSSDEEEPPKELSDSEPAPLEPQSAKLQTAAPDHDESQAQDICNIESPGALAASTDPAGAPDFGSSSNTPPPCGDPAVATPCSRTQELDVGQPSSLETHMLDRRNEMGSQGATSSQPDAQESISAHVQQADAAAETNVRGPPLEDEAVRIDETQDALLTEQPADDMRSSPVPDARASIPADQSSCDSRLPQESFAEQSGSPEIAGSNDAAAGVHPPVSAFVEAPEDRDVPPAIREVPAVAEPPRPEYVQDLEQAESAERDLASGRGFFDSDGEADVPSDPLKALRLRLQYAREEWGSEGQPDSKGGVIGGQLLMRVDLMGSMEEALSSSKALGEARCTAVYRRIVAVGSASGVCLVLMPRGITVDAGGRGQPQVVQLGQVSAREDAAVTSLAFSLQGSILVVGHASGDVNFWEFRRVAWECVKSIQDVHVSPVVQTVFLEGGQVIAVTADSRGRVLLHNVTQYLSLTAKLAGRLSKGVQPVLLTDGRQIGPICLLANLPSPRPVAGGSGTAEVQHACDGVLLICSSRAAFVGKIGPDGKLRILHNIDKPSSIDGEYLPHAAWHISPSSSTEGYFAHARLVMGWGRSLFLYDIPIPAKPVPPEVPTPEKPDTAVLRQWRVEHPVAGLHWLEGPAIAILTQDGHRSHLSLYNADGELRRESVALQDSLVRQGDILDSHGEPWLSHHGSSAVSTGGIVLLMKQGTLVARLMSWQERLSGLQELAQWELALLVGLDVLQAARSPAAADGALKGALRGEGQGANVTEVCEALLQILSCYLAASLSSASAAMAEAGSMPIAVQIRAEAAAVVAILLCLATSCTSHLWAVVYQQFATTGCSGLLLELLIPHILQDQLTSLDPAVMQELVDHCTEQGKPEVVEAAVMHMDIASLDLNQVIKLCREYRLYTALAYLFPRALLDHVAPVAELTMATAAAARHSQGQSQEVSWSPSKKLGFKLLVYLRTCFAGLTFPPGSGVADLAQVDATKAQLLGFLLYGTAVSIQSILASSGAGEDESSRDFEDLLPGPHPVLRCLVSISSGATLMVVREALVGCTLSEAALKQGSGGRESAEECMAEQAVLDAVVELLDAGAFGQAEESLSPAMDFIGDMVAEGRVTTDPKIILKLLEWVASTAQQEPADTSTAEAKYLALLHHLDFGPDSSTNQGDIQVAQDIARRAGFVKAEAQIYFLQGQHSFAMRRFLHISHQAAFDFLEAALSSPKASKGKTSELLAALEGLVEDLVAADNVAFARLVLKYLPERHAEFLAQLHDRPEVQYRYMKGILLAGGEFQMVSPLLPKLHDTADAQADLHTSELFIKLLCQFEPEAVLHFLQSHQAYRVQEILPICQKYGVLDGTAYLLERLGDIPAALDIYVAQQQEATKQLVEAVGTGAVSTSQIDDFERSRSSQSRLLGPRISARNVALPVQIVKASASLKAATSLCRRHSLDLAPDAAQQLWLRVLETYVRLLGQLSPRTPYERLQNPGAVKVQRLLMLFMDQTIQDMAGFIPLMSLGERLLADFSGELVGNFKSSLVGLLGAYNYELGILQAANRLTSSDALHLLHSARLAQHRALHVEVEPSGVHDITAQRATVRRGSLEQALAAIHAHAGDPPMRRPAAYPIRSGCDINFLRSHGVHGMAGG